MALSPGTRLGPYEVTTQIGVGGMGEVYRATDTDLKRQVAIKVLPVSVAADAERLARFQREAEVLASLNHPHIAAIYGLERSQGTTALVMELIEGPTLADRIAQGAIPIDEALPIATQITEALEAAHEQGIVHRDLKPANIKVRLDGTVKVLDFGLAKAMEPTGAMSARASMSPTVTTPAMTQAGMLLGTAAYMSPEQARGRAVDKRADIWAFGCVLYEMLAGHPAFEGETITDLLGAIVRSDPDWTRLPPGTPDGVARLLRRCLTKDVARRLRDIGDAMAELEPGAADAASSPRASLSTKTGAGRRRFALAWVASVVAVGAGAAALTYLTGPTADDRFQKFHVAIQEDGGVIREPVISPDGKQIVYVGRSRMWVQSLDQWKARELAGTEAATRPFWSPAGDWIGYFRSERLFKVPAAGGPVVQVSPLPAVQAPLGSNSGTWVDDGTIVVSLAAGPLLSVGSGGGEARPFVDIPRDKAFDLHDVEALPGGAILTAVHRAAGIDAIGVVKDGSLRIVLEASNVSHPTYAKPGYLIFQRRAPNAGLWAAAFSLDRLAVTGEPFLIGEGTEPSSARDGTLSFLGQSEDLARQLAWFSLDGVVGARIAEPREWVEGLAADADGRRVLASTTDGIWAYDAETGSRSRVTTGPTDITPAWLGHDTIAFVRTEGSDSVLVTKQVAAGGDVRVLARTARFPSVTRDGRRVVFNSRGETERYWEVAWIDLDRPSEIHRLGPAHKGARFPNVSPDGTLLAYISGEVGRDEVFLTRFPSGEGKWQISTEGGGWTRISPRGDAVVYRAPDGAFMSVPMTTGPEMKIGQPKKLFDWGASWLPFYDLAHDGRRGLAAVPVVTRIQVPSVSIVQNWHREFLTR